MSARLPARKSTSTFGELAQLGERLVCNQEVTGSRPVFSTIRLGLTASPLASLVEVEVRVQARQTRRARAKQLPVDRQRPRRAERRAPRERSGASGPRKRASGGVRGAKPFGRSLTTEYPANGSFFRSTNTAVFVNEGLLESRIDAAGLPFRGGLGASVLFQWSSY